MSKQEPRDHHYAPQFYLRNFAVDAEKRKIATVAKNRHVAVWSVRSIEGLGYERDFYVHLRHGVPVSVETTIHRRLETPISASATREKITSGRADALDRTDRPVLYALIRHLQARTPHARETAHQLAEMAVSPTSEIPFTVDEREMYAGIRASPGGHAAYMNAMASIRQATIFADQILVAISKIQKRKGPKAIRKTPPALSTIQNWIQRFAALRQSSRARRAWR